jgi:hypothetical protein
LTVREGRLITPREQGDEQASKSSQHLAHETASIVTS